MFKFALATHFMQADIRSKFRIPDICLQIKTSSVESYSRVGFIGGGRLTSLQ